MNLQVKFDNPVSSQKTDTPLFRTIGARETQSSSYYPHTLTYSIRVFGRSLTICVLSCTMSHVGFAMSIPRATFQRRDMLSS